MLGTGTVQNVIDGQVDDHNNNNNNNNDTMTYFEGEVVSHNYDNNNNEKLGFNAPGDMSMVQ